MRFRLRYVVIALVLAGPLSILAFVGAVSSLLSVSVSSGTGSAIGTMANTTGLSAYAQRTIPLAAQRLYTNPAVHAICPQLPAAVLAGIGTVETGNGTNLATSPTGAQGFMQFEPATFATYGVAVGHPGPPDINNPLDSVGSAANLLCKNWDKKMSTITKVIHDVYNHAWWYACDGVAGCPLNLDGPSNQAPNPGYRGVMAWAQLYMPPAVAVGGAPTQAAQQALAFAAQQLGKPYLWGGTGPNAFDCSGLVSQAYLSAGVTIPRTSEAQWTYGQSHWQFLGPTDPNLRPGDLVFLNPGEQIAGQPGHVAMVSSVSGNAVTIIQAPQTGELVKFTVLGTISGGVFHGPHAYMWDYMGAFRPT